jgi:homoserine kinase type II
MAVYTQVSAEMATALLARYSVGDLIALKGIAEGVENSNYFIETTQSHFILTLYEKRVDPNDLPFFFEMLDHLHKSGCKVPRFILDHQGQWLQTVGGRPACLIEFLTGVSLSVPTPQQAFAVGAVLGDMHNALSTFTKIRPNALGVDSFTMLARRCGEQALEEIESGLSKRIYHECTYLERHWPHHLPQSAIHADLFPDNVLMLGNQVSGLIDFYFASTDLRAYDIAITHAAWSFSSVDGQYVDAVGQQILAGYADSFGIDQATQDAFLILARGACLRFLLTRCYDWINTPVSAIVTRKDPLDFLRRMDFYAIQNHYSDLVR